MAKQKGDILIRRDNDYVEELSVGVNGTTLITDSTQDSGYKWDTPSLATDTAALSGAIDTNTGNITSNDGEILTLQNETVWLSGSIDTHQTWDEGNHSYLSGAIDTHVADLDNPHLTNTFTAVASGNINAGEAVILNSDQTVSSIWLDDDIVVNNEYLPTDYASPYNVYDPVNQVVVQVFNNDTTNNIEARVGTVSEGDVIWGAIQTVSSTAIYGGNTPCKVNYDPDSGSVVFSMYSGSFMYVRAATISGTVLTFGTEISPPYFNAYNWGFYIFHHPVENKMMFISSSGQLAGPRRTTLITFTVSGATITFNPTYQFLDDDAITEYDKVTASFDTTTYKLLILVSDFTNGSQTAHIATLSGTTFSFGAISDFTSAGIVWGVSKDNFAYDPITQRHIIFSNITVAAIHSVVFDTSGTSLTWGATTLSIADFDTSYYFGTFFDSAREKIVVYYSASAGGTKYRYRTGTIIGTTIVIDAVSDTEIYSHTYTLGRYMSMILDPDTNQYLVAVTQLGLSNPIRDFIIKKGTYYTNLSKHPYIGISQTTALSGSSVLIGVEGFVDGNQSGLEPGRNYYIDYDGGMNTTDYEKPFAGHSVSATELIIKGYDDTVKTYMLNTIQNLTTVHINDVAELSYSIGHIQTFTDELSGTYNPPTSAYNHYDITAFDDLVIDTPTGMTKGQKGEIIIHQDSTGGWSITFGTGYNFAEGAPVIDLSAYAVHVFKYTVIDAKGTEGLTMIMEYLTTWVPAQ